MNKSTFVKSVVYRLFASCITAAIAYFFTGKAGISAGIGAAEFVGKIFTYYAFETAWNWALGAADAKSYRKNCCRFGKSGKCVLVSGLNCAGKTTLARALAKIVDRCVVLDGDAVREGINYDLGFTEHDIRTNLYKVSNMAKILMDQGYNVVISCIAKNREDRKFMRETIGAGRYFEVYVGCDDAVLRARQRLLHPDTPVIQRGYERTTDYPTIDVDATGRTQPKKWRKK